MLPLSLQVPASIVLLAGGAIACFAGYRLFRLVLGVYGFILGALIGSAMAGAGTPVSMAIAAMVGGVLGAAVLVLGYFVGVALVGGALAAGLLHLVWRPFSGEPHWIAILAAAALGAIAAMAFQRYVITIGTALGGSWTMLVGAAALMLGKGARAASAASDAFVVYPGAAGPQGFWVYVAWVTLAAAGIYVQFHSGGTAKKKKKS
jgi:hypothetical protein